MQTPLGRVALVAPVLEDAIVKETPVLEGGIAEVEPTSVAIVIVGLASLAVVEVKVTSFLVNSKRLYWLICPVGLPAVES